jgi:hypothetical protein
MKPKPFRHLLLFVVLMLFGRLEAADIDVSGYFSWRIVSGRCTFTTGEIKNASSTAHSGSLRLVLWMTAGAFPSTGYRVATTSYRESLPPGYYYAPYTVSAAANVPRVSGFYNYTIAIEVYTSSGWRTADFVRTGSYYLVSGVQTAAPGWRPPAGAVVRAPAFLPATRLFTFTVQGGQVSGAARLVPPGSRLTVYFHVPSTGATSGSSTVYGGSRPNGAPCNYTYRAGTSGYGGRNYSAGLLFLNYNPTGAYGGVASYSSMSLFYQSATRGFYKSSDRDTYAAGSSYGVFSIQ